MSRDSERSSQTVRVRGIYTTALTAYLRDALLETEERVEEAKQGIAETTIEVVQPSPPIRERFDDEFAFDPASVSIETTRDRQGVGITGDPQAVETIAGELESLAIDTFCWQSETPGGSVFDAEVIEASGGSGAVVDLGDGRRGYLTYDDVDGYVDTGNRYRVQVREPTPPWDDDRPRVVPTLEVRGGLCSLSRDRQGVSAAVSGARGEELVGMTDLLSADVPDGWGLRWTRSAADADLQALGSALERVGDRARTLEATLEDAADEPSDPGVLAVPTATAWVWFGRETRFELDAIRRDVATTMAGHHRIKAGSRSASTAVDFVEAVCESPGRGNSSFPFRAVSRQFGPEAGDRLELHHGKPDGRLFSLGRGEVIDWDPEGKVTLERRMRGGGTYDALDVAIEDGDVAVTKLREGRWWYPTTYRDTDGNSKGTYVNICTPVELFPDCARYVDLYVDVIRHADGSVDVVDEDELEDAVADGLVSGELAKKARGVATAVERALSK